MQRTRLAALAPLAALFSLGMSTAFAQEEPASASAPPSELDAAWQAAGPVAVRGPDTVELRDQAKLQLPDGYAYVPSAQGARIMSAMGNRTDATFLGLIVPMSDASWFVTIDYEESGYIKDDDAKEWDADELLESLREGTEASNEHRKQIGVPAIQLTRWVEPPTYEAATHRLVWSAEVKLKEGEDADPTINYNTYVLGREGYISMNLVTSTSTIDTDKLVARELLAAVDFNDGKRYADFNESSDKVAAYGLTALVGGIAAKKLGLLAVMGAFLLKFAKVIVIGVVALGGIFAKFFKRKSEDASA
jgi:uncharacterized membrane-anchored protein